VQHISWLLSGPMLVGTARYAADTFPKRDSQFKGTIDPSGDKSLAWPQHPTAPKGVRNVILILHGDVGFGATSTFGGPAAKGGVRYYRLHVNSLCLPTRAALVSDRNDSEIGFASVIEARPGLSPLPLHLPKNRRVHRRHPGTERHRAFGMWHNNTSRGV